MRSCRRTGCRWPAVASLSYRYDTRQVWLLDLAEPDPSLYDLCPHHADTLTVPRGWERVDQRSPEPVAVAEPAGRDLARSPAAAHHPAEGGHAVSRSTTPRSGGSRYSVLRADLPRLAAELADQREDEARAEARTGQPLPEAGSSDERSQQGPAPVHASGSRRDLRSVAPAPLPSRDLSPMPAPALPSRGGGARGASPGEELAGQLAIPVEHDVRADERQAVVVSLDLAGARRRSEHLVPAD